MLRCFRTLSLLLCALLVAAQASAGTLTIAWDANTEPDVTGYILVYGTAPGSHPTRVDVGNTTQFAVNGLTDGLTYYFCVQAYNSSAELSDLSAEVSSRVGPWPAMSIDSPANNATFQGDFLLGGWAIDRAAPTGTGVDALHVWAFPAAGGDPQWVGVMPYGGVRGDIGAAFGAQFTPSGFTALVRLSPGTWDVVIYSHSTVTGAFTDSRGVRVKIVTPPSYPLIVIDTPRAGTVTAPFMLAGWAIDLGVPAGGAGPGIDTIHVWAYPDPGSGKPPVWIGVATMRGQRADLAAAFGSQFRDSGYAIMVGSLPAGLYRIVTYAHSTITGTFATATSVDVTIR